MTPNSSTNRNTGMDDHPAADGALIDTSSVIAVARAYLGNFLAETSEQFDGDNYAVRRNYWRVLRAIRHLSNFEISSAATLVLAASAQYAPELSAVEDIGSADICEGAEEVQNTTNPLITILPVPCIVVTAMTAETLEVAADSSSILSDTKTQQNASKPSQMACDNKTIVDSTSVTGKSSTVIVTTNTSTNEISATSSLVGFPVALSASVVAENYRIKCRADALSKYMSSMGTIDRDTQFQTWLIIIKDYWAALRVARRGPESKHPLVTDPLVSVSKINAKVDVPVVIPMTYTSVNQIAAYMGDQNLNNQPHAVDLTSDRMHMSGFAGIARNLSHMHPAEVNMTLWGVDSFDQWSSLVVSTNPSYSYEDNPLPGWSKNICVRMGGKNQGSLEITYSPPERTRRMRSKMEIQSYFTKYNLPNSLVSRFDFRSVFCVCHTPEDGGSYLECSFGRAGCNRWLHPQCVGLGKKKEGELRDMVTVVCPFCTVYLESIGAKEYLKNKL